MQLVCLLSLLKVLYTPHRGPIVVVSYGPALLLWQLGLDTEQISVPFSLKPHGVPSPCGHNCMLHATVCLTVMPLFSDITKVSTIGQFQEWQKPHPLISCCAVQTRYYRLRIKSRWKLPGRQWELNPQPSEQLRPMTIKTSSSTEMAMVAFTL